jgi:opacity protein-like surface antigen
MKIKLPLGLTFFAIVASGITSTVKADPILTYNHVDLSYQWTSYDDSAIDDAQGLVAGAQWSPIKNFFLEGSYEYQDTEVEGTDIGVAGDLYTYGAGAYLELNERLDLVGHVAGQHVDIEADGGAEGSDDGFLGTAEVRYALTDKIELDPFVQYSSLGGEDTWTYGANAVFALNNSWALTAGIDGNDDADLALRGGARWSFDCGNM